MKRTMPRRVSTSGAKSRKRKRHNNEPNITLVRRELIPQSKGHTNTILWFMVSVLRLMMPVMGLCMFIVSGFSLKYEPLLLYGIVALTCLIFTAFFYDNWLTGARAAGGAALVLVTALVALFLQNQFISGFKQIAYTILARMNNAYDGDYTIPKVTDIPSDVSIFLLLIFIPLTAYFGAFIIYRTDTLMVGLLVFPVIALMLLMTAKPTYISGVLILLGVLAALASDRVGYRKKLWGEKDSTQWNRNWLRRQKISSSSAALMCLASGLLMIPSFFVLMPSLSLPIAQTTPFSNKVEGKFAQIILSHIPDEYRGQYSSQISTYGGGVEDGGLTDSSGYLINGVEDLALSCTVKPEETLYLKGFIGGDYKYNQWTEPEKELFASAASNWSTEGKPEIYINNLPFMRLLYDENDSGSASTAAQLTVQRINANDKYTYIPYNCYLNEYYNIVGGDGAVKGQSVQDDIFSFYSREEQKTKLAEEYFVQNESGFDRLERSYSSYASEHYKNIPEGYEQLQEECDAAELKDADVDDIISFVQDYLVQNYEYSMDLDDSQDGEDAVLKFLFKTKKGYSTHFASAAAIMFRMFGLPSRYVVGYAASVSLFTQQPDGSYQAVLQSDNAHAWAEIYVSGTGWMPVETTPGQLGLVQDVEFYGKNLSSDTSDDSETPDSPQTQDDPTPTDTTEQKDKLQLPWGIILTVFLSAAAIWIVFTLWRNRIRDLGLDRKKTPSVRVRYIFAAYYRLLLHGGMERSVESTSEEFGEWVNKLNPTLGEEDFEHMMNLVLESCFGQMEIQEEDVVWIREKYYVAKNDLKTTRKNKTKKNKIPTK